MKVEKVHIAPCGINCVLCVAFQRKRKPCGGCNAADDEKPKHCVTCPIRHCVYLPADGPVFCYACTHKFPCRRLREMDKHYRLNYGNGMLDNLCQIRDNGFAAFAAGEQRKWICPSCARYLCIHSAECLCCGAENPHFITNRTTEQ